MIKNVTVYDNGESIDRYTVVHEVEGSKDFYGMGEDPQMFNQYLGSSPHFEEGDHLGTRLKTVPKNIEAAIMDRIA